MKATRMIVLLNLLLAVGQVSDIVALEDPADARANPTPQLQGAGNPEKD